MTKHVWLTMLLGACLAASCTAAAADHAQAGTLHAEVDGLSSPQPVYFDLWNSTKGFLRSKPFQAAKVAVVHGRAVWNIGRLPYGTYAVSAWQDLNGNGKLDSNGFGAPVEPVGFSNNAQGHFGPPAYEDAKITFDKPARKVTFKLACPMRCASQ